MASDTGKRYQCSKCGSEFVVTKGGKGDLVCCATPMAKK
ncbi:MAG: desulfoferrodoxin [Dehalococcoidia bacterium]|nr:desulfoferrodoxin [Dehalococcoidia bacterium]